MKIKHTNSINILSYPFKIEKKPKNFQLELNGKKLIGKCDLSARKIILKENDLGLIPLFHEICEGRHLLQHESLTELEIHQEAIFWLSIHEQLAKSKKEVKHGRK
jgi:hypothetical protein